MRVKTYEELLACGWLPEDEWGNCWYKYSKWQFSYLTYKKFFGKTLTIFNQTDSERFQVVETNLLFHISMLDLISHYEVE